MAGGRGVLGEPAEANVRGGSRGSSAPPCLPARHLQDQVPAELQTQPGAHNYFKRLYLEKSGAKSIGTKANLLVAAAAGACTVVVTQVQNPCIVIVFSYKNIGTEILFKRIRGNSSQVALSAFAAFLLGAISKSVATILTYPLIRCKVMIQAADPDEDDDEESERPGKSRSPKTMLGALHAMWNKEGIPDA
ncbi:hypothetical protein GUJ93_ZPchr0005g15172 [Zizania palustris]|uniref:Uncharacterized protein n=1 Tax=Zizania palustris TaxID=103762 RepID=A0A8J5T9N2_ZIZPA|nr:hypothetical protein GUJ93_ZPchr0005g15172 [Zizania palustris]